MNNGEMEKIRESTDPSMDEMGVVPMGYIPHSPELSYKYGKKMTKREALLRGDRYWKSEKELQAEREEEQNRRESEKEQETKEAKVREEEIKEIKESTDPSMDEIVNYSWREHPRVDFGGVPHYSIVVTKREKLLIDLNELSPYEIWEKQESERSKEREKKREEERQEILNSTDSSMDEIITFRYCYESEKYPREFTMTKRQKILYDKYLLTNEEYKILLEKSKIIEPINELSNEKKGKISLKTIKRVITDKFKRKGDR